MEEGCPFEERFEELRPEDMNTSDSYTWDYSKIGHYTEISAYWLLTQILNKRNSP